MEYARHDLARLARMVCERRLDLGYETRKEFASASGISLRHLGAIEREQAENPRLATLRRLDKALRWTPGSSEAILRGGMPQPEEEGPATPSTVLAQIRRMAPADLVAARHLYAEFHGAKDADDWLAWAMDVRERTDGPVTHADEHLSAG